MGPAVALLLSSCAAGAPATRQPPEASAASQGAPAFPGDAHSLVGDSPAQITATLGVPSLKRDEGGAEFWLYAIAGGCRVHLILYREGARETVAHAAATTPPHKTEAACLREIAAAKGTPLPVS